MNTITVDITAVNKLCTGTTILLQLHLLLHLSFLLLLLLRRSNFSHSGAFVVVFGNDHDQFPGSFLVKSFLRPQYTIRIAAEVMGLCHEAVS